MRANNLLMWEGIKYYAQQGCKNLNLGRTDLSDEGLRQYKNGWNTNERIQYYYRYDINSLSFLKSKKPSRYLINDLFKRMPIKILKLTGRFAYKYTG